MRFYNWYNNWHLLWSILRTKNRHSELTRLIKWARNKNLDGPEELYLFRLNEEDRRLMQYNWRHPHLFVCAQALYLISYLVSPTPRYLPRGSASHYRYRSSTKRKERGYSLIR